MRCVVLVENLRRPEDDFEYRDQIENSLLAVG